MPEVEKAEIPSMAEPEVRISEIKSLPLYDFP
jgi:hypothetical protein